MLAILPALISRYLQVIFLDSDNVAVADVGQLFQTPQYTRYGALLWPDYWESSAAPDILKILGLQETPLGTTESGQMVFDKARFISAVPQHSCHTWSRLRLRETAPTPCSAEHAHRLMLWYPLQGLGCAHACSIFQHALRILL